MNIKVKDLSQIEKIIAICDKYVSLYNREFLDNYLYCETALFYALPSFIGEKLFEIINIRALEELLPYLTGYEKFLDGYYTLISTFDYSDFLEKCHLVANGEKVNYDNGGILENGEDLFYFMNGSNPFGLSLTDYSPSFFNEKLVEAYRDAYWEEENIIQNMGEQEVFQKFFPYMNNNLETIPSVLINQFYNDCLYSEESIIYLVRTSKCIPAFEHWDNMFDATQDSMYRRIARESIIDLKYQDYMYSYIGVDDICYRFEDKNMYYDVRRIYQDQYIDIAADNRYLYPDVFFKRLKLEVLITYLNKKYHFYNDI